MLNRKTFVATAALALSCASIDAFAWNGVKCGTTNAKWSSNVYAVSASAIGFPVGPWRDALSSVISRLNSNPSNLAYSASSYSDTSVGLGNGQNETWWTSGFGAPAVANWWIDGSCRFKEVDIRFDNTVAYHYTTTQSSLWPYGGSSRPFQTTAMHEFGHAGGLHHTSNTYSIMGSDWTHIHGNGGTATAYLGEDATAGLVSIYGLWSGAREDLGVAHWRRIGASGEYSTHARTRMFNASGVELSRISVSGQPVYLVKRGQTVKMELSYENMGKSGFLSNVPVGYYVSTNDFISTLDTFLGSTTFNLARDSVLTTTTTLNVPSNLVVGRNYWLGAIIDHTAKIAELREDNNATYIGIRVQ